MDDMRVGRTAIAAITAASLVFGSSAPLAQTPANPVNAVRVCRMQERSDNPGCQAPESSAAVNLPDAAATPETEGNSTDGHGGLSLLEIVAAIVAVVLTAFLVKKLTGSDDVSMSDLERNGPKTPETELLGLYEVQGLVYPGWPLVVEVNADADATTFVQVVTTDGSKLALPPLVLSDAGGRPWGNSEALYPIETERTARGILAKFLLPEAMEDGGQEGFHTARLSVASGRMQGNEFSYSPLEVFALGSGPTAVGSAAVEITRFAPSAASRRADYQVTFNAPRTFNNLNAELVRRETNGRQIRRSRFASQDLCRAAANLDLCEDVPPQVPFPIVGSWPTAIAGQLQPGQSYHMELRAYTGRIRTGGWLVSQAPQVVTWP